MKRRSFLVMLGLAPVAGSALLESASQVGAGEVAAQANFRMSAVGNSARIAMEVRNTSSHYRSAGMFLDVPDTAVRSTRVVFKASEFRVLGTDKHGYRTISPA